MASSAWTLECKPNLELINGVGIVSLTKLPIADYCEHSAIWQKGSAHKMDQNCHLGIWPWWYRESFMATILIVVNNEWSGWTRLYKKDLGVVSMIIRLCCEVVTKDCNIWMNECCFKVILKRSQVIVLVLIVEGSWVVKMAQRVSRRRDPNFPNPQVTMTIHHTSSSPYPSLIGSMPQSLFNHYNILS